MVSNKNDKTAVVSVEMVFKHPLYHKVIKKNVKFAAHDEKNECKIGDQVVIVEIRPLSKKKRWRVEKVVGHKGIVKENDPSTDQA